MSETDKIVTIIFGIAIMLNVMALYRHNKALREFYRVMNKLEECIDGLNKRDGNGQE